jgi:hypothetical protein
MSCRAELRTGRAPDGSVIELRVDPVSLAALEAARRAGGSPASYSPLPELEEVPLRILEIETRLEIAEDKIERFLGSGSGAACR